MASSNEFPKPKYVTGGCLCGSLRYRIDFPENHDFDKNSFTCQCTQCRRNTGSFFLPTHHVLHSAFRWTSADANSLSRYQTTPTAERGICTTCGSFLYWRRVSPGPTEMYIAVGCIDPLFLFGEGADGTTVPKEGFGRALASGAGCHVWCDNEIPGVTSKDRMEYLHGRGQRCAKND
ncbi:Mss4-like protein [Xylaria bambusicola]|uniref:Mss4-like protein n=1 Tax=Xylaria bambusicola TaxID=326684 RepID=UPI002008ABFD|nr:Mss4-like protein [Xylaria bambusicola]KAI0505479.1 Mss4-like protein [Xylaria bambusicola]